MIDYDFYSGTFGGNAVSPDDFNRYLTRATAMLNRLTFNSIVQSGEEYGQNTRRGFQPFTGAETEALQFGLCALIDKMHQMDSVEQQALSGNTDSGNVKSRSSGGESISYESKKTVYEEALADESKKTSLYRNALLEFAQPGLFRTNPFFAGSR